MELKYPKRLLFLLLPLFSAFLLVGCGTVRVDASVEDFPIEKNVVPSYKSGQAINVINYYTKPNIVKIYGDRLDADLKQYTDTALKLLEQGLKHQNVTVDKIAKKSIKMRLHNVQYVKSWTGQVDVNITSELGNHFLSTIIMPLP